jgi:hypothetical protein
VNSGSTDLNDDIESIRDGDYLNRSTRPWAAGLRNDSWLAVDGSILVQSLRLADTEYHPRAKTHGQLHERIKREETQTKSTITNSKTESIPLGEGTSYHVDSPYIPAQKSTIEDARNGLTNECHDSDVELFRLAPQRSWVWCAVDCTSLSVETLGYAFFPST